MSSPISLCTSVAPMMDAMGLGPLRRKNSSPEIDVRCFSSASELARAADFSLRTTLGISGASCGEGWLLLTLKRRNDVSVSPLLLSLLL